VKVPKDVDLLMWELAERGDPKAFEEFVQRYPQHRAELIKRASMVSGLKEAKIGPDPSPPIPRFIPRQSPPQSPEWRWAPAFAIILLGVLAYASYLVTASYVSKADQPRYVAAPNAGLPDRNERITPKLPEPQSKQGQAQNNRENQNEPPMERPITIKIERAPLLVVLDAVAAEAGLLLEVGPKMPNPEIRMEYVQVPGTQILNDLGRAFGFTALKQGERRYLIVPAIDPQAQREPEHHLGVAEVLDPGAMLPGSESGNGN